MNFNSCTFIGRLTRDPESRTTSSGKTVCRFGLAVNDAFKPNDRDATLFLSVECWGKTGETAAQYLKKGSEALVSGSLRMDVWQKDGQDRREPVLNAKEIQFGARADRDDNQRTRREPDPPTQARQGAPGPANYDRDRREDPYDMSNRKIDEEQQGDDLPF